MLIFYYIYCFLLFVDLACWRKMEMQQQQMEEVEVQMAEPATTTTTSLLQEETEKMDNSINTSSSPKKDDDDDHQSSPSTKTTTEQACVKVGDHIILCVNEEKYTFAEVLPSGSVGNINLLNICEGIL